MDTLFKTIFVLALSGIGGLMAGGFAYATRPKAFHKLSRKDRKQILGLERALSGGLDPEFDIVEFAKGAFRAIRGIGHDIDTVEDDTAQDIADVGKDIESDAATLEDDAELESEEGTD